MLIKAKGSPVELKDPGKLKLASCRNKNKILKVESRKQNESKFLE